MTADLPPGKWSAWLVGAWWPARPDAPSSGVAYWRQSGELKRNEAADLHNERSRLTVNQGRTADDLMERYSRGEQRLATLAEQCDVKSQQSDRVADTVNNLRDRLTEIARSANADIDRILSGQEATAAKVAAINLVIARANASAANAEAAALSNIVDATQRVLDATIGGEARQWLSEHGVNLDGAPPSRPITADDIDSQPTSTAFGRDQPATGASATNTGAPTSPPTSAFGRDQPGPCTSVPGGRAPKLPAASAFGRDQSAPPATPQSPTPTPFQPSSPTPSVTGPPLPAASPPAATAPPLCPQPLTDSFTTGIAAGAPAAAGAHTLSTDMMSSASEPPPPAVSPPTPAIPASTAAARATTFPHVSDTAVTPAVSSPAPAPPPTSDVTETMTPVAPVVAGGPAAVTPVASSAPAGPLPAYGADLRPPVFAPPAPSVPAGPVSGAAVASSASSSPAAGGSVMSAVTKSTAPAATTGPASGGSLTASSLAAATAGAAGGHTARRSAEQQRLQRIVDAVARQEPGLSWAAGLRQDGPTTLLVTDLAGGWIPPHVRLPAHVTLLEPAVRRHDIGVIDLLGAVATVAVHRPHDYLGEPDQDAPELTGDRTVRSVPQIDELGPTLAEYVRRRDGLPRVTQAVVVAATRHYGVPENEVTLLSEKAIEIRRSVLAEYPNHDPDAAVDWMLLAALNTLIEGDQSGAHYHLAWAIAATSTRRST